MTIELLGDDRLDGDGISAREGEPGIRQYCRKLPEPNSRQRDEKIDVLGRAHRSPVVLSDGAADGVLGPEALECLDQLQRNVEQVAGRVQRRPSGLMFRHHGSGRGSSFSPISRRRRLSSS